MKRIIIRILKWGGIALAVIITLPIAAGLLLKTISPDYEPNGRLIDVGGFRLHLDCKGETRGLPILVIEAGAGTTLQSYHWLQQGLMNDMRVCRYDRSGQGFSDEVSTPRDADTVSRELHALLQAAGESPPYLLAGHSLGGPYIRVFTDNYPGEVVGLIFLDSSHPGQIERLGMPENAISPTLLKLGAMAGDLGLVNLYFAVAGSGELLEGLPEQEKKVIASFYRNGKPVRTAAAELKALSRVLDRAGETTDFGDRPIRVFTAGLMPAEAFESMGLDPVKVRTSWLEMQKELAGLSSNGKQMIISNGNHNTIFMIKDNADIIVLEVRALLKGFRQVTAPIEPEEDTLSGR